MNIHEYQAKAVLSAFGVPIAAGFPAFTAEEAVEGARKLGGPLWVVKSQIHAGGRGKGRFKEASAGDKGGVRLAKSVDEVKTFAAQMLGATLVTVQTGPARQAGQSPLHRGRRHDRQGALSCRRWSTARRAGWRSSSRPRAASISRTSRTTRRKRSIASPSIRRPGSCPITAAPPPARWPCRRPRQADGEPRRQALCRLPR